MKNKLKGGAPVRNRGPLVSLTTPMSLEFGEDTLWGLLGGSFHLQSRSYTYTYIYIYNYIHIYIYVLCIVLLSVG